MLRSCKGLPPQSLPCRIVELDEAEANGQGIRFVENIRAKTTVVTINALHEMLNRLSVIIGNCDLLIEKTATESECAKLLSVIHQNARGVADKLIAYQFEALAESKTSWPIEANKPSKTVQKRSRRRPVEPN